MHCDFMSLAYIAYLILVIQNGNFESQNLVENFTLMDTKQVVFVLPFLLLQSLMVHDVFLLLHKIQVLYNKAVRQVIFEGLYFTHMWKTRA
jgi:hypothetical protein